METLKPRRAYEVSIRLHADDLGYLLHLLDEIEQSLRGYGGKYDGVSGGYSGGYIVQSSVDESITHDAWENAMQAAEAAKGDK